MTDSTHADVITALMVSELRTALISNGLFEGINLHVTQQGGRVPIHVMAVSTSSLGVLLATLTDPAELDDPDSLSCRITPGDRRIRPDQWHYELAASRYPDDHAIALFREDTAAHRRPTRGGQPPPSVSLTSASRSRSPRSHFSEPGEEFPGSR